MQAKEEQAPATQKVESVALNLEINQLCDEMIIISNKVASIMDDLKKSLKKDQTTYAEVKSYINILNENLAKFRQLIDKIEDILNAISLREKSNQLKLIQGKARISQLRAHPNVGIINNDILALEQIINTIEQDQIEQHARIERVEKTLSIFKYNHLQYSEFAKDIESMADKQIEKTKASSALTTFGLLNTKPAEKEEVRHDKLFELGNR